MKRLPLKIDFRLDVIGLTPTKKYSIDPMLDPFMYQDCKSSKNFNISAKNNSNVEDLCMTIRELIDTLDEKDRNKNNKKTNKLEILKKL